MKEELTSEFSKISAPWTLKFFDTTYEHLYLERRRKNSTNSRMVKIALLANIMILLVRVAEVSIVYYGNISLTLITDSRTVMLGFVWICSILAEVFLLRFFPVFRGVLMMSACYFITFFVSWKNCNGVPGVMYG